MRKEIIRKERIVDSIKEGAVPCSHADLYAAAQQEIAEHETQAAMNAQRMKEFDEQMHQTARENGANAR